MTSIQVRPLTVDGRSTPAVVISYLARRMALFGALSALFSVGGVFMLVDEDLGTKLIGALAVLFFGGGAALLAFQARRPGFVALTRDGILAESPVARVSAPWDAIIGVGRQSIGRSEMIVIDVDDPSRIRTTRGIGWLRQLNSATGFPDLAYPTNLLGGGSEVLEAGVRRYVSEPERRARIGDDAELRSLLEESGARTTMSRTARAAGPASARWLLWALGALAAFTAILSIVSTSDPDRGSNRLLGAVVIGLIGAACLVAAWQFERRPRLARVLGLLATAGLGLIGWLLLGTGNRPMSNIIVGIVLLAAGLVLAWLLFRWRAAPREARDSGEPERRPDDA